MFCLVLLAFLAFTNAAFAEDQATTPIPKTKTSKSKLTDCDRVAGLPAELGRGKGVAFEELDPETAIVVCKGELEHAPNNARLSFNLGRAEDAKGDYGMALAHYRQAIQKGSIFAVYNFGQMYEFGSGVGVNYEVALQYYRRAARLGDPRAIMRIGTFYDRGLAVKKNEATASRWYHAAAELDDPDAMYFIASSMEDICKSFDSETYISKKCRILSHRWYLKSAEYGNVDAMIEMGNYYRFQHRTAIAKSSVGVIAIPAQHGQTSALRWFREAAKHGSAPAMLAISTVDENIDEAVEWFIKGLKNSDSISYATFLWVNDSAEFQTALESRLKADGIYQGEISRAASKDLTNAFLKLAKPKK